MQKSPIAVTNSSSPTGTAGLSVAFDLPTQIGYDSDRPMALGEVGKVGVAIDSIEDMERLFAGIPLDQNFHLDDHQRDGEHSACALRRRRPPRRRRCQASSPAPCRTTSSRSTLRAEPTSIPFATPCASSPTSSPGPASTCPSGTPSPSPATTCARRDRPPRRRSPSPWPTASPTSRLPSTRASTSTASPRDSPSSSTRTTIFSRRSPSSAAARRIWAGIMRDHFGAKNPRSWMLRFHTQTAGSTLTAQQPENNIVRTAIQALSAVLGGTQSLHTNGYDEALALPTEEAARIALRTQQIIAIESGVANTIDPFAGSYYVESLTNEIEQQARCLFRPHRQPRRHAARHRARLGAAGDPERRLRIPARRRHRRSHRRRRQPLHPRRRTATSPSSASTKPSRRKQVERLRALRARRDPNRWQSSLNLIRDHARSGANLMPAILEAVESYATVGEIAVDPSRSLRRISRNRRRLTTERLTGSTACPKKPDPPPKHPLVRFTPQQEA